MKAISLAEELTVDQVDAAGRRLARRRERAATLASYQASGLTQRAFAAREGINFYTFCNWLRRARAAGARRRPEGARFLEVSMPPAPAYAFEVVLPGGLLVRGHQPEATAALVRALD